MKAKQKHKMFVAMKPYIEGYLKSCNDWGLNPGMKAAHHFSLCILYDHHANGEEIESYCGMDCTDNQMEIHRATQEFTDNLYLVIDYPDHIDGSWKDQEYVLKFFDEFVRLATNAKAEPQKITKLKRPGRGIG